MSEPYVGEIEMFAFNFAPKGWALCQGQVLPISQNSALFSLLGTYYGGDGRTTFALPNLQGNVPVGQGQGPGLSSYHVGQAGGESSVTLATNQMASHTHTLPVSGGSTNGVSIPGPATVLDAQPGRGGGANLYGGTTTVGNMAPGSIGTAGGGQPHNNMAPYVSMNYCIALQGVFPPRN